MPRPSAQGTCVPWTTSHAHAFARFLDETTRPPKRTIMGIIHLTEDEPLQEQNTATAVDIVAIHGIFEDALQTWTDPESDVLWLRDLLSEKLRNIRVMIYQYKVTAVTSPGVGEGSQDRILAQATTLIAELQADRQLREAFTRPIIFICHGLGGLLAKRALAYSDSRRRKNTEHLRSIYTSTYGMLFLGTPHSGIEKETLLATQTDRSPGPSQFMISLLKGSEMLNEITDQFAPLMKRFAIFNFWEDIETEFGNRKMYIVDQESAAPAWNDVEKSGIAGTHSTMVKFSSQSDHRYRLVLEALSRYVKLAPTIIRTRWRNEEESIDREREQEAAELRQHRSHSPIAESASIKITNEWCLVPRSPSAYFTGRRKHAQDVKKRLGSIQSHCDRSRNHLLVLYGLGGSGKTQFCLKYVEEHKHSYWGVFWIDASDEAHIESGFASIGEQAGRGSSMKAGIYWLSRCTKPWLLIFDNADDPDLNIEEYCPSGGNGHVLVTTRNPRAAEQSRLGQVRFRGMEAQEAVSFLLAVAYPDGRYDPLPSTPKRWKLAEEIAIELGFLPLALAHAGATIRRNIYTLERYLDYYLRCRKTTMSYSRVNSADEANIITTWEIPFKKIAGRVSVEHRDAVDLMHMFAFMHFESVPECVFQRPYTDLAKSALDQRHLPDILQSTWGVEAQARLRRAIGVLCDHSIIDYEPSKASCSMHPVVHNWARDRLAFEEQKRWLACAMEILAECISPSLEASGRKFRALLLPHISSCLQAHVYERLRLPDTLERAGEYERFAWVFAEQCLWKSARKWQQKAVEIRIKLLGRRHQDTIRAQRSLGQTLWNLFEIKEAIGVQLQVLNTLRWHRPSVKEWTVWPTWKPIHVPYCVALTDLTLTLWLAGRRELSKMTGERAVDGLTRRLGAEDPRTLTAMFNLARTYLHLGEHEKSHALLVRVLRLQKHFFGLNHPDTLMTRNEVAVSLCARKRHLAAAERLLENVLQARKRILGAEHAYTLWSVNDLSKIYSEIGRFDEAVKILEEIIPVVTRTLGDRHVGMLMTRSNLGKAYFMAGRWKDAESAIEAILDEIPSDHPDRIHNLYGYAMIKFNLGSMSESEHLCVQMLDTITKEKILALDNPRTVAIADLLLRIYRLQGREDEVVALKKNIPGTESVEKDDRFDPYAIRKGSDVNLSIDAEASAKERSKSGSEAQQAEKRDSKGRPQSLPDPKPKLVVRHTF